jgi:hypothetical protein
MSGIKRHLEKVMDALESGNYQTALGLLRELGEDKDQLAHSLLFAVECLAELEGGN